MATSRRALHFVFKVADRTATAAFYREILGMKVSGIYYVIARVNLASVCVKLIVHTDSSSRGV